MWRRKPGGRRQGLFYRSSPILAYGLYLASDPSKPKPGREADEYVLDVLLATSVFAFAPALRGQACQRWLKSDLMISNSCREITNSRLDGAVSAKMNRRTGCVTAVSCRATASFDLTSGMRGLRHPSTMTHGSPIVSKRPGARGNANGHYALR